MKPEQPISIIRAMTDMFGASSRATRCAMSHGQLTIDGYVIKPTDQLRWTRKQLQGRSVVLAGRVGQFPGCRRATWQ